MEIFEMRQTIRDVILGMVEPFTLDYLFYRLNHGYLIQNRRLVLSVVREMEDAGLIEYVDDPVIGLSFRLTS